MLVAVIKADVENMAFPFTHTQHVLYFVLAADGSVTFQLTF
jgi:hypothetical protein